MSFLSAIAFSPWTFWTLAGLFVFYKWCTVNYGYFDGRGIAYRKPLPLLGNLYAVMLRTQTFQEVLLDLYGQFADKRYART